jgi:PPOX class probable F420-dependent enzyme
MSPREKYLSLETYRKNGTAVATPVWFATAPNGAMYVYSEAGAAKVKRARNNPKGRIAPCDVRGNLRADWEPVTLRIIDDATEAALAQRLLDEKYGLVKKLLNFFAKFRSTGRAAIAITPA